MDAKNVFNSIIGNIQNMDVRIDSWNSYYNNIKRYFEMIDNDGKVEEKVHLAKLEFEDGTSCDSNKKDIIWNGVENYNCFLNYVEGDIKKHRLIHSFSGLD